MKKVTITRREIDAGLAHASTDVTRGSINSVRVSRKDGWTRVESTDGRRLIRIQHKEEGPAEYNEMLNPQDLKTASKLVTGAAANPNSRGVDTLRSFVLSEKDNREKVSAEVLHPAQETEHADALATLRTVPGTFPNTDMVLPDVEAKKDEYLRVNVNPNFLIDAAKALKALCGTQKYEVVQIHVKEESGNHPILITGEHKDNGTRVAVVIMPIRMDGSTLGAPYPEREETVDEA